MENIVSRDNCEPISTTGLLIYEEARQYSCNSKNQGCQRRDRLTVDIVIESSLANMADYNEGSRLGPFHGGGGDLRQQALLGSQECPLCECTRVYRPPPSSRYQHTPGDQR